MQTRGAQVRENLGLHSGINLCARLELDNHRVLNHEIQTLSVYRDAFVEHIHGLLSLVRYPAKCHLV